MTKTTTSEPAMTVGMTITEKRIEDLLITAFEGGIGYWACINGYKLADGVQRPECAPYGTLPLKQGCAVVLVDTEKVGRGGKLDPGTERWTLDREAIQKGMNVMAAKYPRHWANFVGENEDAETGDVFVQCCLFGELVYG